MKNQTYRMTMLFDFYGETLTERQKEFFDLYYNEDLSLGEIAENYGISRQGVRDVIVRAEASMQEIEDKTGLIRRFMQMQPKIAAIEEAAQQIKTLNYRQYENPQLEALATEIMASPCWRPTSAIRWSRISWPRSPSAAWAATCWTASPPPSRSSRSSTKN